MDTVQEVRGDVQVLIPSGRLDTDSAADFELTVQDLLAANAKHFVIDLSKIGYVSSAGLRVLLMLAKGLERKGTLRLSGLNPQIKQVFDIAGFTKLFSIHPDLDAALDKHPHAGEPGPDMAKLAAKIMGAESPSMPAGSGPADPKLAKAAAGLLGADGGEAKAPAAGATPAPAPAAPAEKPAAAEPAPEKKGVLGRLFGRK